MLGRQLPLGGPRHAVRAGHRPHGRPAGRDRSTSCSPSTCSSTSTSDEAFLADVIVPAMAPGAVALLSVPAHPRLFSDHDRMLEHARRYRPRAFRRPRRPPPRRRGRRFGLRVAGPAARRRPRAPAARPPGRAARRRRVARRPGRHRRPRRPASPPTPPSVAGRRRSGSRCRGCRRGSWPAGARGRHDDRRALLRRGRTGSTPTGCASWPASPAPASTSSTTGRRTAPRPCWPRSSPPTRRRSPSPRWPSTAARPRRCASACWPPSTPGPRSSATTTPTWRRRPPRWPASSTCCAAIRRCASCSVPASPCSARPSTARRARHYVGRLFATASSLILDMTVYDTQCGAKVLRAGPALRAALATPFHSRWAFDVELLGRLHNGVGGADGPARVGVPRGAARGVARPPRQQARTGRRAAGGVGPRRRRPRRARRPLTPTGQGVVSKMPTVKRAARSASAA